MKKLLLYIAMSLDGFIAREDNSLDWLFRTSGEGDNGYSEFYKTIDTILMGRKTYEQILILENGKFPYKDKKCYVFSRQYNENNECVEFINDNIGDFVNKIKNEEGKRIWLVGGGELLHEFLKHKLVDEIIIQIAPIIIGKGIRLFKEDNLEIELILKETKSINNFSQLYYKVK
ncbi:dihydrofolate reductase [Acetoanaerobium pronyense]|uniref:Dihydrofolate reductase n=1 Tax=Acetoanaerobium pronyense TaxID=1482736 RepID=A0ABS4KLD9_9FIRM|nr:dihydrofolate reductase family protein [Acetoanaerobium pronyense]MBP2028600.1 dihydrofolate reductase [Acetoanaerobium pronyense]